MASPSSNGGIAANGGIAVNGEIAGTNYLVLVLDGAFSVRTTVTASPQVAISWVQEVLQSWGSLPIGLLKGVGLAIEPEPNLLPGDDQPAAVLQLCVENNCLIFQLLHCNSVIPPALRSFLSDPHVFFVGVDIERNADRLQREHGLSVMKKDELRLAAALDLQKWELLGADMKRLVREVMGIEMERRPEAVRTSAWQQRVLSSQQIAYACADAFAASELGNKLLAD